MWGCSSTCLLLQHHGKPKRRTFPLHTLYVDAAAQQSRKLPRDGQPQAGTTVRACDGAVCLGERIEYHTLLVGRNTDTGIAYHKPQSGAYLVFAILLDMKGYGTLRCKLDGVTDQAGNDLAQPPCIAPVSYT